MKKRSLLALALVIALLATAVGGTLAYFTDTEEATNVFTVGNVDIVLHEQGEIDGRMYKNQDYRDALAEYMIMPGVTVGKEVWVENVGKAPAYIRVVMTIPNDLELQWALDLNEEWNQTAEDMGDYTLYTFELKEALAAGDSTGRLLKSFGLAAEVTEYAAGKYEIPVYAYAIQTAGFENAEAAFAALTQSPLVFGEDATYTTSNLKANGSNGVLQATTGTLTIEGNGIVNAEMGEDEYAMAVWANGGNVVINGGTFIQSGTGNDVMYDLIYASKGGNITINGGIFKSVTPQWTLNVSDASRDTSHITVKGGRFYKFDPSNAQTGEGEITVHEDYKVIRDGDWYEVVERMEYTTIDSVSEFIAFADAVTNNTLYKGYQVANNSYITVSLTTDIDLTGATGSAAANANQLAIGNGSNTSYHGTFDGQGHTISNYTITDNWTYNRALFRTVGGKFTFKNVIFDTVVNESGVGVENTKTRNIGVVCGLIANGNVTFENITIKNATIEGSYGTAFILGGVNGGTVNMIDCRVENSKITTKYHYHNDKTFAAGMLFANLDTTYGGAVGTISGNAVSNVTWYAIENDAGDVTTSLPAYIVNHTTMYNIDGEAIAS